MPKRSKEDTEVTIHKIMDVVVEQLLTIGYDKMSYTTLSNATGISRTGISHHFPKKTDFTMALDGQLFKIFLEYLDFDSGLAGFSKSWIESLEQERFLAILRLVFHHVATDENTLEFAKRNLERLILLLQEHYGPESKKELEWLLGRSMMRLAN